MSLILLGRGDDAPPPRRRTRRLTDEMRALAPGESFIADAPAARCYVAFAHYHKFKIVTQKQPDGTIRVWRIA